MNRFYFITYLIGAFLLLSSFNVQKCADALKKAYEEKDYDAFVDAFPDKYEDFVNVYYWDNIKNEKMILYDHYVEHLDFLFNSPKVIEGKVLDKLLSLSYNYIWGADAVSQVIYETEKLLLEYPNRFTEYFSGKTDEEVISFIQMALTNIDTDNSYYLKGYYKLLETYTPYSGRIVKLAKIAFERAKKACDVLVVY